MGKSFAPSIPDYSPIVVVATQDATKEVNSLTDCKTRIIPDAYAPDVASGTIGATENG